MLIKAFPGRPQKGFTLIELLAVCAVIAILAAILIPVAGRVRGKSQSVKCQNNLRQIAMAAQLYRNDNDGRMFKTYDDLKGVSWYQVLIGEGDRESYLGVRDLACPMYEEAEIGGFPGYGMTSLVLWHPEPGRTDDRPLFFKYRLQEPDRWPLFADADFIGIFNLDNPQADQAAQRRYAVRHDGMANVVMVDGHVETVPYGVDRWHQAILNNGRYYTP